MNESLFNRIGGEAAVEAAANLFYEKFLTYDEIKPFFKHISIPEQQKKIRAFLTQALGGPSPYTSFDLRRAHAPLLNQGLNDAHVDLFIKIMRDTLLELNIPIELIEEFIEITESFRRDVLCKPT
jgi:hemoglobin